MCNDPLDYADPSGLCRITDVEFRISYLDGDPIEVLQGPEGGWDYEQCKSAGLCSSELPIVYDDEDTAPPGGFLAPTGEGNTAWCGPAWDGPSPFMQSLSRVRISSDVCPLVGCAGFVFQDGHLTVFGGPGLAVSAPSLGASLAGVPLEPGAEDWNRVLAWVAWFGASCTWDGTWSKDPDRSCQPGVSKEFSPPKAGAGFAHEWSFTWELW